VHPKTLLVVTCSSILAASLLTAGAARAQPDTTPATPPAAEPPPPATEPPAPEPMPAPRVPAPAPELAPLPAPAEGPPPANLGSPRAFLDYSDGTLFLRSADDNLVLVTGGRVHIDTYAFRGPGVDHYRKSNGSGLTTNMFFRRFVLESGGLIRKHWFFWVGGNFAPTQIDANQAPTSTAAVYDGFVGYQANPQHQLYVGQYNAPFTMENVTSSRWVDFMERALVIRTVGAPYNKDLGITYWGATKDGAAPIEYQIGVLGGDGMNRPSVDNRVDVMGRFLVRPLTAEKGPLERLHVGVSARYGSRDNAYVSYDAPTMSTPGGYAYWSPTYTTADKTEIHVIPSGNQIAVAGEVYVPFERFDFKGEVVYVNEGRREAASTARNVSLRHGTLEGVGGYGQVSYWPLGTPRVNGHPAGRYINVRPPKGRGTEAPYGLQLAVRAEAVRLSYDGNSRTEQVPDGAISAKTNNIRVNAFQAIVTYWATKHVRLSAEYSLYTFPGNPPSAPADVTNQAAAPGAKASPTQPSADHLHELGFRVGLAL
jgi:phosphate-selective porin